jgi:anti-sigma regulatory factor (Ser/Thr protein kinase)
MQPEGPRQEDDNSIVLVCRMATDSEAPRTARDLVADLLGRLDGQENGRRDDLMLIASEMVSNAVVHGPAGLVGFRVSATAETVRMEVTDRGVEAFEPPSVFSRDGHWGLHLIREFGDRSGIERMPWTLVWCEVDLPTG